LFLKDGEESRRSSSRFLKEGEPGVDMSFVINREASTPKEGVVAIGFSDKCKGGREPTKTTRARGRAARRWAPYQRGWHPGRRSEPRRRPSCLGGYGSFPEVEVLLGPS
jgi:hypothetical protein